MWNDRIRPLESGSWDIGRAGGRNAPSPALDLASRAILQGGTAGAVLNAANEAVVEAFLAGGGSIPFGRITELVREAMDGIAVAPVRSLGDVLEADRAARAFVRRRLGGAGS